MTKKKIEKTIHYEYGGRPVKWDNPDDMQKVIDAYFLDCDKRMKTVLLKNGEVKKAALPRPYTVQGLALALNLTVEGLWEYGKKEGFSDTIKTAKSIIEENKLIHLLDGDGYGPGYIFDLKNNYKWTDKQQHEISGPDGGPIVSDDLSGMTNAQLEKRLKLLREG